ncbi:hypothetical protein AiwAL_19705, partial [Acidiphilium sp. AL]|uniref:LysR substrate-binding domain-containing protein n=1 Tax=Acidiphilium sp. AL TaxID=2871704 RepID=UPI0021CB3E63
GKRFRRRATIGIGTGPPGFLPECRQASIDSSAKWRLRPQNEGRHEADLLNHNCLVYSGLHEAASWPFIGPDGPFSVAVQGSLSSNSVETIRMGVLAGVGIGFFTKVSLAGELAQSDVITVLDDFVQGVRDISLVWPKRRFVPERVRRVTDFLTMAIPKRL